MGCLFDNEIFLSSTSALCLLSALSLLLSIHLVYLSLTSFPPLPSPFSLPPSYFLLPSPFSPLPFTSFSLLSSHLTFFLPSLFLLHSGGLLGVKLSKFNLIVEYVWDGEKLKMEIESERKRNREFVRKGSQYVLFIR